MDFVFPAVGELLKANGSAGDFIAVIADDGSAPLVDAFEATAATLGLSSVRLMMSPEFQTLATLADLRRSDHASFWARGYPGMMITDTSEFRNTHYHCAVGEDSVDRLDHLFATRVVQATVAAAVVVLSAEGAPARAPSAFACDVVGQDCPAGQRCRVFAPRKNRAAQWRAGLAEGPLACTFGDRTVYGHPERVSGEAAEVVPGADVLLLAVPANANEELLRAVATHADPGVCIGSIGGGSGGDWLIDALTGTRCAARPRGAGRRADADHRPRAALEPARAGHAPVGRRPARGRGRRRSGPARGA
jgi:hypothetical protein